MIDTPWGKVVDRAPLALKAGNTLIPWEDVASIDITDVETEHVVIRCRDGKSFDANGVDAIDAVMLIKPSALEGRRLKWKKGAWALHNLVGHPVMQILAWLGLGRAAVRFHDHTTPRPRQ